MRIRLAPIAGLIAALAAGPVFAAEPDAPVTTAPAADPGAAMTTAEQIDAFIKTTPAPEMSRDEIVDGPMGADDGKPHGEVGVAVGSRGYRSVYGRTTIPVGKTGQVTLAFEDSKGDFGYGRGLYGGPYGGAYGGYGHTTLGGSLALGGAVDRQRCDREAMTPQRPLDTLGGPNGRCVRAIPGW